MERKTGFEPATPALARQCSTPELLPLLSLIFIKLAGSMGFEPTVSGVTGQRVRPLHHDPAKCIIFKLTIFCNILMVGETGFEPVTPSV